MTTDTISFVVYLNLNHHSPWPALLLSGSVNETKKRATPWKLKKYSGFMDLRRRIALVTKSVSSRMSKSR